MTKEETAIIIECCKHFNFWYSQHSARKDTTLLGRKYRDFYVNFDESPDYDISVKIYNGLWEGNPKCVSLQMPVETKEDLLVPFIALGLNEVVSYLKNQFKTKQ